MIYIIVIALILLILVFFLVKKSKKIVPTNECVVAFTGGLGSGKTYQACIYAVKKYKENYKKWKKEKDYRKLPPLIYSNIPIEFKRKGKKIKSVKLTIDILTLNKRVREGSIIIADEFGAIASQYDWNNDKVLDFLNTFMRDFRQFTKGGYLIITDQRLGSMPIEVRNRINTVYNCLSCKWILGLFVKCEYSPLQFTQNVEQYTAKTLIELKQKHIYKAKNYYDTYALSDLYYKIAEKLEKVEEQDSKKVLEPITISPNKAYNRIKEINKEENKNTKL